MSSITTIYSPRLSAPVHHTGYRATMLRMLIRGLSGLMRFRFLI